MEDLFNLLEKIFPVVIFIFWIIVSIAANARKNKQRRQLQTLPSQTPTTSENQYKESGSSDRDHTNKYPSRADVLKKRLESVFGELAFKDSEEEHEEPTTADTPTTTESRVEKVPIESVPFLAQSTSVPRKYSNALRSIITEEPLSDDDNTNFATGISISELRKAVIWSEIIAPPVALRRDV